MATRGDRYQADRAVLSKDMLDEAIPGNIRKAEHFIAFLKRFIEYLKASHSSSRDSIEGADRTDENASTARRCRDPTIVLGASKGNHLHRA